MKAGRPVTHGMSRTRTYRAWEGMLKYALRPGGPGCDVRWKRFKNFHDDMGTASKDWQLRRIDKSQPYNKESTVWEHKTTKMQVSRGTMSSGG